MIGLIWKQVFSKLIKFHFFHIYSHLSHIIISYSYIISKQGGNCRHVPFLTNENSMGSAASVFFFARPPNHPPKLLGLARLIFKWFEISHLIFPVQKHSAHRRLLIYYGRGKHPQPRAIHTTGSRIPHTISHASTPEPENLARRRPCTTVPPRHHGRLILDQPP